MDKKQRVYRLVVSAIVVDETGPEQIAHNANASLEIYIDGHPVTYVTDFEIEQVDTSGSPAMVWTDAPVEVEHVDDGSFTTQIVEAQKRDSVITDQIVEMCRPKVDDDTGGAE
tara:strand:+ start:1820 stop:2158 length:339 start_codon:yes stop_codon:yes gene_type:complete